MTHDELPGAQSETGTREGIIRAATGAFAAHGFLGTTNKIIAAEAGITPGLIYHYFQSKRDLFNAVHATLARIRYDRARAAMSREETIGGKIEALATDLVDMWREDSASVAFQARTLYEGFSLWGSRELEDMWTEIVEDAQARGELPDTLPTKAVTDMCTSWFTGLVLLLPERGAEGTLASTAPFVLAISSLSQKSAGSKSTKPRRA